MRPPIPHTLGPETRPNDYPTPGAGGTAVAVKTAIDGQALISLIAGVLTVIFLVIQIGYTVRKWQREESGA